MTEKENTTMTQSEMPLEKPVHVTTATMEEKKPEPPPLVAEQPKPPELPRPPQVTAPIIPVSDIEQDLSEPSRALSPFANEQAFRAGQRMARAIASSSLVPKDYQGEQNISNVMIAAELAHRIGASILMVMQNLDVVHGRPGWRSSFLIATVNVSKRFTPLRFRWQGKEGSDDWGCRCYAKDNEGEECLGSLITIGTAKAEGWHGRNGSKWKTIPEQMLMYRAASFWTRIYAPELSLGMHTADEIIDTHGEEVTDHAALPVGIAPGKASVLEAALRAG